MKLCQKKIAGSLGLWLTLLFADQSNSEKEDSATMTGPLTEGLRDPAPSLDLP